MTYKEAFVATSTDVSTYVIGLVGGIFFTVVAEWLGYETSFISNIVFVTVGSFIGGTFTHKRYG